MKSSNVVALRPKRRVRSQLRSDLIGGALMLIIGGVFIFMILQGP